MRSRFALVLAGLLAFSAAAHADTYSLTFYSYTGVPTGTGSLSFDGPTPVFYDGSYTEVPLTSASATVDGVTFDDSDLDGPADVVFYYGSISDYDLGFTEGSASLSTFTFNYFFLNPDPIDYGSISATLVPPSSITPEPGSLILLGSGLLGVLGAVRRRAQV